MSAIYKQGGNLSVSPYLIHGEVWKKTPKYQYSRIPTISRNGTDRVEEAFSFILIFFFVQSVFFIAIVTALFPVLFSTYQIFQFFCKTTLSQNLVVIFQTFLQATVFLSIIFLSKHT